MQSDGAKAGAAADEIWRAFLGGALVVVPGLILVALGAPLWLTTLYLGLVVVVLGIHLIRRHRDNPHEQA